ncbi:MAG TPA: cytochrome c biogenesis protein DipZ [Candidatus Saccharimonadales bacterium]|nr:cytochrome c biogenesis protein DipZ [Candidatus Saccharimonadales bacterium]
MILLLVFAFLSGLVTILAPCIWPLLPIILSSSLGSRGHAKPLGITLGIMLSFGIFTLFIATLVRLLHFDPNILRLIAVIVIGFLGLTMLVPGFGAVTEVFVSRISGMFGTTNQRSGFFGGFITGLSLGIVWAPCAGPILAAIAALAATGKVNGSVVLITVAYVLGTGIPLFIFAYAGQTLFTKSRFISRYTGRIQQLFGVIMILTAILIYTNYDTVLQAKLLNTFPAFSQALNGFESNKDVTQQLNALKGNSNKTPQVAVSNDLFNSDTPAPEFVGINKWLNSDPLTISKLKGKVVLVDFWTYTCINCIRTLPHVTAWYDKYKDSGFVVVSVHTPEFAFEHDTSNVLQAIKQYNIHYPVAQDNDYATWNAYQNQYWPAEYLIDAKGNIRRTHFGEGEYDQTEQAIQELLKEAGQNVSGQTINMPDQTPHGNLSPETYLGTARMQYLFPNGSTTNGTQNFKLEENPSPNSFSFGGTWTISDEDAVTGNGATLVYNFTANKVFLVMKPPANGAGTVKVFLDGKLVDSANAGADVQNSIVTVDQDRLYNLIDLKGTGGSHILKLEFQTPGTQCFAFTFG